MASKSKDQHPASLRMERSAHGGDPQHHHHGQVHSHHHGAGHLHAPAAAPTDSAHQVKDPVCGMMVDPHGAQHKAEHAGRPYYFCSAGCRAKFLAEPDRYLDPTTAAAKAEPVPEGTIYTCPMHPEIRQVGPGSCPICGMALEPLLVSLEAEPNPELIDMRRRFWIGLVLTIPVFILEMGGHLLGLDHLVSQRSSNWIQLILATPVVLWAGWPFFQRGWQSLVTRNLNMFTLIAMGTGAAWIYSVVATLAPGIFPDAFRQHDGSVAVYFEAAAVITVLVLLGQVLELRARESTSGAIRALCLSEPILRLDRFALVAGELPRHGAQIGGAYPGSGCRGFLLPWQIATLPGADAQHEADGGNDASSTEDQGSELHAASRARIGRTAVSINTSPAFSNCSVTGKLSPSVSSSSRSMSMPWKPPGARLIVPPAGMSMAVACGMLATSTLR